MRVVVTGGSGLAGRHVVADLQAHALDVVGLDRVAAAPDAPHRTVDMLDFAQVLGALRGADAVVHLAAIPRPGFDPPAVLFRTNVLGTFNVLEACAELAIGRVVLASSISALGFPFFERPLAPAYVPIDEQHPRAPQDPYGLTKLLGEEMADAYARRTDMQIVSLRLAWIHTPESFSRQLVPFWSQPGDGASNLWSYIDARDVATACRLALTAPVAGHALCFVAAPDTCMPVPSTELTRRFYPTTEVRPGWGGRQSLISSERAGTLLHFAAQHTWSSYGLLPPGSRRDGWELQ